MSKAASIMIISINYTVNDALKAIGATADGVRDAFFDFQKFLYEESVA